MCNRWIWTGKEQKIHLYLSAISEYVSAWFPLSWIDLSESSFPRHCTHRVLSRSSPYTMDKLWFFPSGAFDSLEESQNRHLQWWPSIAILCRLNTLYAEIIFVLTDQRAQQIKGSAWIELKFNIWIIHCVQNWLYLRGSNFIFSKMQFWLCKKDLWYNWV